MGIPDRARAYKLKKPVSGDGFDFRPVEARRRNAIAELHLNRRVAPDVYLGVVPIVLDADGKLAIGGTGTAVDWLVKMVRLNAEQTLERRLGIQDLSNIDIVALARRLAWFYAEAFRVRLSPAQFSTRIRRELAACEAAFRATGKPHLLDSVSRSRRRLISFLNRRGALFRERIRRGRIVDGHGDLRPEHIYLNGTPRIIDCLEFRSDLRTVDPVSEIAYLALECGRLGDHRIETQLLQAYQQRTGDKPSRDLFHFYSALNALIRARPTLIRTGSALSCRMGEPGSRVPKYCCETVPATGALR
jgi:uncharacterized protein